MSEPTIEQMNEAIAKFVGGLKVPHPSLGAPHMGYYCHQGQWWNEDKLQYHTSWDWIMPVVEKAMNLRVKSAASYNPDRMFRIEIVNGYTKIEGTGENICYNSSIEGSMLIATYKAVYQFIQWYNQQKEARPATPDLTMEYRGPNSHCKACEDERAGIKNIQAAQHTCKTKGGQQ